MRPALTGFALDLDASGPVQHFKPRVDGEIFARGLRRSHSCQVEHGRYLTWRQRTPTSLEEPAPDLHLNSHAANLSDKTLPPGLYKWTSTVGIATVSSTLTFEGTVSDVWIMQITGTFTAASASRMVLKGGRQGRQHRLGDRGRDHLWH